MCRSLENCENRIQMIKHDMEELLESAEGTAQELDVSVILLSNE